MPALKYWDANTSAWKTGAVGLPSGQVWQQIIGDGLNTSFQVTHGFGTRSVYVSVYRNSPPYEEVEADVERTDTSSVTVRTYPTVPAVSEFIAVVASAGTAATANITMDTWHTVNAAGEPAWGQAGIGNVGSGYSTAGFRKSPDGKVYLRGVLVATAAFAAGVTLFVLPAGYRPPARVRLDSVRSATNFSFVDVLADGTVTCQTAWANGDFLALDGLVFDTESVLQTASVTAQPLDAVHFIGAVGEPTFAGTWVNLDNNAAVPGSATQRAAGFRKDAFGKVRLTGVIKGGSNGQTMFTLPAGYRPRTSELSQITYASLGLAALSVSSAGVVAATGVASGNITTWIYLDGFEFDTESVAAYSTGSFPYLPITMDPWHAIGAAGEPAFQNSWANAAGSAPVAFRKDPSGVVHLHGGTANGTNNTTILTLPAGYRPPSTRFFVVLGDAGAAGNYVSIDPNGVILGTRSATTLHLGDIEFDTESVLQTASVAAQPLEPWHTVGAAGEPAFQNSWVSYDAARAVRFRKYPDGRVRLSGAMKTGAIGTVVFTLPTGYRPPAGSGPHDFIVESTAAANTGVVSISDTGTVAVNAGAVAFTALFGIEFDTETQASYPSAFVQINAPARVTTLPTSPVDGQECYYVADATNGVLWHLRYNAGSSSAYKWELVGGPEMWVQFGSTNESTLSATYTDLTSAGPSLTLPLAGDYMVGLGAWGLISTVGSTIGYMSYQVGATAASDNDAVVFATANTTTGARFNRKNALTAGAVLFAKYKNSGGGSSTATFNFRWLSVRPVRVG
jgi:hypothetical protein